MQLVVMVSVVELLRQLCSVFLLQIKPYNIYVTVAYPPDTDTPGLAEENKTKVCNSTEKYLLFLLPVSLCKFSWRCFPFIFTF